MQQASATKISPFPGEMEMEYSQSYWLLKERYDELVERAEILMFERFTERARKVITLAQEEARELDQDYIGEEHIFAGLIREEEGLAARVLKELNVTYDDVRLFMTRGDHEIAGQIPFSIVGKKILEGALKQALSLGHNYIGTEHILLSLISKQPIIVDDILDSADVTVEEIKETVIRMISGAKESKWKAPNKEDETLNADGQKKSEQDSKKAQVTITYGDLTLKIEDNGSGLAKRLIKNLFE